MKIPARILLAFLAFAVTAASTELSAATETPIPKDGRLNDNCANHLVKFEVVKTDCSININNTRGTFCFASDADRKEFESDLEGNMSKAQAFYEQVVKPGKYVPIPPEALTSRASPTVGKPK